ncbi:response regulator transcription factor, partial [Streptomyces sp. NPDC001817]|uniref:response regulator transcription factor n=1 Tax=Streptomyces sp. NPDC001817 TaxID=3154398 RepID=UPI0033223962
EKCRGAQSAHLEEETNSMSSTPSRVRVVVADDHPIYRLGLVHALCSVESIDLIAEASCGKTALEKIRNLRPDVAILDLRMPELDAIQIARTIAGEGLPTKVIVISAITSGANAFEALRDGAVGYLTKDVEPTELGSAVLACSRGEVVCPPAVTTGLITEIRKQSAAQKDILTDRETQVLGMIAEGMSIPEIAKRIYLAPTTIKSHVKRIYEKLGVSNRGAVVAEAIRRGLLE